MTEFNHILNALPWPSLLVGPDLRVGRLRKVLTQFGAEDVIRTVRGSGYALY